MTILFDFAARVVLVGLKVPFDRLLPDYSTLALVRMFGRFDNEVVWDALKCFGSYAWTLGTVMDGAVQGNTFPGIDRPIWHPLKAAMPHDADPAVGAPGLFDHSPCNHDGAVNDVALSHREHAVDRQEPVGVDAHPIR